MIDFRCSKCRKLMAKVGEESQVEIKCPWCNTMNIKVISIKPTGQKDGKIVGKVVEGPHYIAKSRSSENKLNI